LKRRKGDSGEDRLFLGLLLPLPTISNKGCKRDDQECENACADFEPCARVVRAGNWFGGDCRNDGRDRYLYFSYESIAPSRQRLNEPRALGRVPQNFADFVDGGVQVALDIDKGVGPETLL